MPFPTKFKVQRQITVRREFRPQNDESVLVHRDCGIGCTCNAQIWKCSPVNEALAEQKTFCFSSSRRQGISELAGTARAVAAPAGVVAFQLQANIVEWDR